MQTDTADIRNDDLLTLILACDAICVTFAGNNSAEANAAREMRTRLNGEAIKRGLPTCFMQGMNDGHRLVYKQAASVLHGLKRSAQFD